MTFIPDSSLLFRSKMANYQGKEKIKFKDPNHTYHLLDTALRMEIKKFERCPVGRDWSSDHEMAEAWAYVVAGYFLIEQGLKALLNVRGEDLKKTHELLELFEELPSEDQDILREYYDDLFKELSRMSSPPRSKTIDQLDKFLRNLDRDRQGHFDIRYFLTQVKKSDLLPFVSINLMHEIVHGCTMLFRSVGLGRKNEEPNAHTYSRRFHRALRRKIEKWAIDSGNRVGWVFEENQVELVCGPDSDGQYGYWVFEDNRIFRCCFDVLSKIKERGLKIMDKRDEFKVFDPDKERRSPDSQ